MPKNLLVIEDNTYIGEKIVNASKKLEGIQTVKLSKNLKDSFTFLKEKEFDKITLDLSLPDGNGIEILKWLRQEKIEKKVYVFSTNTELKQICLKYGATAFFDKSDGFDELISTIEKN